MLSYGHARWAEPESNRRPPPYQRGALPPELSAVVRASGRGWNRTSSLLCVRQALSRVELLARADPGQGIEPRSPRSERGVLPVRRPRSEWGADASPSIPRLGDRRSRRGTGCRRRSGLHVTSGCTPNDVVHATRLPFDPGSPTADCADPQRSSSYVEGRWSPSSGRALRKRQAKANA